MLAQPPVPPTSATAAGMTVPMGTDEATASGDTTLKVNATREPLIAKGKDLRMSSTASQDAHRLTEGR
jgi:hypothetical protein